MVVGSDVNCEPVIKDDVVEKLTALKQQPGKDIAILAAPGGSVRFDPLKEPLRLAEHSL